MLHNQAWYERKKAKETLKIKYKKDIYDIKEKYKTEAETKKMYQYSKILTTAILILTMLFNSFFYFFLVPFSGKLGMTDQSFETVGTILLAWNSGTIIFFIGYFAKALFETKWERENTSTKDEDTENIVEEFVDKAKETIENL